MADDDLVAVATAVGVLRDARPPTRQPSPFLLRLVDTLTVDPSDLFGPIDPTTYRRNAPNDLTNEEKP